jgi:hypothetical protein
MCGRQVVLIMLVDVKEAFRMAYSSQLLWHCRQEASGMRCSVGCAVVVHVYLLCLDLFVIC